MTNYKRLPDGTVEPVEDIIEWGRWFQKTENRIIEQTELPGDVCVSTVFLGIDHAFGGGPPVLWETMVFGGPMDGEQSRYRSEIEARAGHSLAVELAKLKAGQAH
jgi:hypothetical protein